MTARFVGFPERMTFVPLPSPFFGPLLQEVDSLAELKLSLHVCRRLHEGRGTPRYVRRSELVADRALLTALRPGAAAPANPDVTSTLNTDVASALDTSVASALDAAVRRGMLVAVAIHDGADRDICYLLNTPSNARIAEAVARGERTLGPLGPAPAPAEPDAIDDDRPSIFELYEQNVGLLTPLIAEELREAEQTYPDVWVEDAFREAVAMNKRNWRYIRRILETWAARGRGTRGTSGRRPDPAEDPRKFVEGRYGRLVRR